MNKMLDKLGYIKNKYLNLYSEGLDPTQLDFSISKESIIRVTLESKTAITFKKAKKFHKINILIESAEMVTFSKEFKVLEIKTDQNDVSFLEIQCLQDSPGFEFFVVKYYKANNIKWVI
jgi:hypothetical protein